MVDWCIDDGGFWKGEVYSEESSAVVTEIRSGLESGAPEEFLYVTDTNIIYFKETPNMVVVAQPLSGGGPVETDTGSTRKTGTARFGVYLYEDYGTGRLWVLWSGDVYTEIAYSDDGGSSWSSAVELDTTYKAFFVGDPRVFTAVNDHIVFMDSANNNVEVFDTSGTKVRTHAFPGGIYGGTTVDVMSSILAIKSGGVIMFGQTYDVWPSTTEQKMRIHTTTDDLSGASITWVNTIYATNAISNNNLNRIDFTHGDSVNTLNSGTIVYTTEADTYGVYAFTLTNGAPVVTLLTSEEADYYANGSYRLRPADCGGKTFIFILKYIDTDEYNGWHVEVYESAGNGQWALNGALSAMISEKFTTIGWESFAAFLNRNGSLYFEVDQYIEYGSAEASKALYRLD